MSSIDAMTAKKLDDWRIVRLRAADTSLMKHMLCLFGKAFGEQAVYQDAIPSERYLQELLGSDTFFAVAALQDETVIGGLAGYALRKFEQERTEFYIYDLAVAREWRRRGVATALISGLKSVAAAEGAYVIFVQADAGDDPAIALYESLGTREVVNHFDIVVPAQKD